MSTELGEFFSLIGKARQEKEEEFQSLVGEINIDSLFAEVKTSVAEDKKKKKKKLEEDKVILSRTVVLDNKKINLPITVFLSISIHDHTEKWLSNFERVVKKYDEITEVHRLTGTNSDYQITILSPSIDEYDNFQQKLIKEIECTYMSSHISLQIIKKNHKLSLDYLN